MTGMTGRPTVQDEFLFKVLVVGDIATGKTSLIRRSQDGVFTETYRTTIGVDFALKTLPMAQNTYVHLQLWDIAGQERFGSLTRAYYKEAAAALIVFDLTRSSSFDSVKYWKKDIADKVCLPNGSPLPVILLANKCDLIQADLNAEVINRYCHENGFVSWFATSAKENINIEESMAFVADQIVRQERQWPFRDTSQASTSSLSFTLQEDKTTPKASSSRCCN